MGKQKHRNESREVINYHRLGNLGQLVIKINEQLDLIHAILLMTDEERAVIRKQLEDQDEQRIKESREQDSEAGGDNSSDLE